MIDGDQRRTIELAGAVEDMGETIRPAPLASELQYLAFLSLSFLLPRLTAARKEAVHRYESALDRLGDSSPTVAEILKRHLSELKKEESGGVK